MHLSITISSYAKEIFPISFFLGKSLFHEAVIHYLEKDPEEMSLWLSSTKRKTRKLDKYRAKILEWLRELPDLFMHLVESQGK